MTYPNNIDRYSKIIMYTFTNLTTVTHTNTVFLKQQLLEWFYLWSMNVKPGDSGRAQCRCDVTIGIVVPLRADFLLFSPEKQWRSHKWLQKLSLKKWGTYRRNIVFSQASSSKIMLKHTSTFKLKNVTCHTPPLHNVALPPRSES